MSTMPLDSAWRQYKGAVRDRDRLEQKVDQARQMWERVLLEQMLERIEQARDELGLDVADTKVLLRIGVPCTTCLTIVTTKTRGRHKLFVGGADSPAVYAECNDDQPINPADDTVAMPTWPDMPKVSVE